MLTEQGIKRYIKSDIDIIFLEASPSTNLEAKSIAATAREGTVIFARRQLSGRGRMGRGKRRGVMTTCSPKPRS